MGEAGSRALTLAGRQASAPSLSTQHSILVILGLELQERRVIIHSELLEHVCRQYFFLPGFN